MQNLERASRIFLSAAQTIPCIQQAANKQGHLIITSAAQKNNSGRTPAASPGSPSRRSASLRTRSLAPYWGPQQPRRPHPAVVAAAAAEQTWPASGAEKVRAEVGHNNGRRSFGGGARRGTAAREGRRDRDQQRITHAPQCSTNTRQRTRIRLLKAERDELYNDNNQPWVLISYQPAVGTLILATEVTGR